MFAKYGDPTLHKHFAKHILVSNKPFVCLMDQQEYVVRSMIIQSQIIHSIRKDINSHMVVFLIDETSELSKRINHMYLGEQDKNQLPRQVENEVVKLINNRSGLDCIDEYVISDIQKGEGKTCSKLDSRILFALKYIEACEGLNQDIYGALSDQVCLSKSRFSHLFKENVGIDLKNYLLLKRMEKTYQYVTEKQMSITEAAIASGFSSASHFSEACRQHYGISLTDFIKAQNIAFK